MRRAGGRIALACLTMIAAGMPVAAAPAAVVIRFDRAQPIVARDVWTPPAQAPGLPALPALPGHAPPQRAGAYESNPPTQPAGFPAVADAGTVSPASPSGAVGPSHIVTVTNQEVKIQTRAGGAVSSVTLAAFWASLGNPVPFDPRAVYDPLRGRFIVMSLSGANSGASSILMAVTATGDPTGQWYRYRVEADGTRDRYWADKPSLGFSDNWVTVQVGMFEIGTSLYFSRVFTFDRADIYDNGTKRVPYGDMFGFGPSQTPAVTLDTGLGPQDLVQNWRGSQGGYGSLRVWRIEGTLDQPSMIDRGVITTTSTWADAPAGGASMLPQAGTTAKLRAGDARIQNVVRTGGSLWAAHTVFLPAASPTRAAVQWWQIEPGMPAVAQRGRVDGSASDEHYAYPSIAVNANKDVVVAYGRFGPAIYPSAAYSFRYQTDPPGALRAPIGIKSGEAPYATATSGIVRWGEWSAAQADPANTTDFWTLQSHAAAPSGGSDRWGTWWSSIHPNPGPSIAATPSPMDFGAQRTATPSVLRTVTVFSDGQQPVQPGAVAITGTNAADFAIGGNGCAGRTLLPNETCAVTIRFTPAVDGPRAATLTIAGPQDAIVDLIGTGVPPEPSFKATPTSLGFGNVIVGEPPVVRTVTVTNGDAATLAIGTVTLGGADAADFTVTGDTCTGAMLPAGPSCTVTVAFAPATTGPRAASLTFTHNAPGGGVSGVAMTGSGIPPGGEPRIVFQPSKLVFPATEPDRPATIAVRVYNVGTGVLVPTAVTIPGAPALSVPGDECTGAAINPGAWCALTVRFAPTDYGLKKATLIVAGNLPAGDARTTVEGVAADITPPESSLSTANGDIVIGGGPSALADYNLVRGSVADRLSAVTRLIVTYRSRLGQTTAPARLDCDATGRTCAFSAPAPMTPGFYEVFVEATDAWGNKETPKPPIEILVV